MCDRCIRSGITCDYDIESGVTRQEHLRPTLEQQNEELACLQDAVHWLRYGTDQEATEILAHLRLGASIEQLSELFGNCLTR
jgi:hypothetical protein